MCCDGERVCMCAHHYTSRMRFQVLCAIIVISVLLSAFSQLLAKCTLSLFFSLCIRVYELRILCTLPRDFVYQPLCFPSFTIIVQIKSFIYHSKCRICSTSRMTFVFTFKQIDTKFPLQNTNFKTKLFHGIYLQFVNIYNLRCDIRSGGKNQAARHKSSLVSTLCQNIISLFRLSGGADSRMRDPINSPEKRMSHKFNKQKRKQPAE